MKNIIRSIVSLLLLISAFSVFSCSESGSAQEDINEALSEKDYLNFERYDLASEKLLYSFDIPAEWESIYDKNTYSGSEAFFNKEKTLYALIGFEKIEVIESMGIKNLNTKKDFIDAAGKLKNAWEESEFLTEAAVINEGKIVCDNENIKAYALEMEALADFSRTNEDFKNFNENKKQLVYILFLNYENDYIGYFALTDSNLNKKTDMDILGQFTETLKILGLKK